MSLFYDLKLKRQKTGSAPCPDVIFGPHSSSSSVSDHEDSSPSSSPSHSDAEQNHHRRFSSGSSTCQRETGSPSDISPTRSSDGDSLLSSPLANSSHMRNVTRHQQSHADHLTAEPPPLEFALRHNGILRAKSMAQNSYPAIFHQPHFQLMQNQKVALPMPPSSMIDNVNAATQFVGNILYRCLVQPRGTANNAYANLVRPPYMHPPAPGPPRVHMDEPVNLSVGQSRQSPESVLSSTSTVRRLLPSASSITSRSDVGSEGEEEPTPPTDSPMICMICGDKATGLHYGIITCEGYVLLSAVRNKTKKEIGKKSSYRCFYLWCGRSPLVYEEVALTINLNWADKNSFV